MTLRLALLLLLETCGVLFFGLQLLNGSEAEVAPAPIPAANLGEQETIAQPARAVLPATATSKTPLTATGAPTPAADRSEAIAKWDPNDPVGIVVTGTVRWRDGTTAADARIYAKTGEVAIEELHIAHEGLRLISPG